MARAEARGRGQGSVEFLVIFLGFAALLLGLLEMTRLYRAKHVLNTATFAAARAGSLHNAGVGAMNAELANGMVPVLTGPDRSAASIALARRRAGALLRQPGTGVQIVSPKPETVLRLRTEQWVRLEGQASHRWQKIMPNDNLRSRPRIDPGLADSPELNLQDANLLKVRSVWCHRLVTPVLDRVIFDIVTSPIFIVDKQRVCAALRNTAAEPILAGFYIAVSADAIVRMQSVVSVAAPPSP